MLWLLWPYHVDKLEHTDSHGERNPIVFPSQWRSTDRRERVYGADIYMLSARLPVFVKLQAFFSHLCKILSFLCPAGKYHVITVQTGRRGSVLK